MKHLIVCLLVLATFASAQSVVGSEHNRNLRQLDYLPMLMDYHRQTVGESRQFFTYPRRNYDFIKNFADKESNALVYYADSLGSGKVSILETFQDGMRPHFFSDRRRLAAFLLFAHGTPGPRTTAKAAGLCS